MKSKSPQSILEDEKWVNAFMVVIKVLVVIWDILTFPIYYFLQRPWETLEASMKTRAISVSAQPQGPYRHMDSLSPLKLVIDEEINTLYELFLQLTIQLNKKLCLGTREILAEEEEKQPNGRVFKKFVLGNYNWKTYREIEQRVREFSCGLRSLGQTKAQNVVLFAETREEWLIGALACFRFNIPVVTLYANLGDEALIHGINETEVNLVITSHELLPKFKTLLPKTPRVEHIIYMEGFHTQTTLGFPDNVKIHTFNQMQLTGRQILNSGESVEKYRQVEATRDDVAIIMYTSGSTGLPKGVMLSHGNILQAISGFSARVKVKNDDIYLAYLPLAHVLELAVEFLCLLNGVPIGYSSPQTISDKSTKVKRGCKGDARLLQPTFMASVPLILDRIYKSVLDTVAEKGLFFQKLFDFAYEYKKNYMRNGFKTPLTDLIVFRSIRKQLGGNLRLMVTGGAPLSPDTHDFIRICLCTPLLQGYGLTETCACSSVTDVEDLTTGRVGPPMMCCDIELENWEEGNYRTTDRPFPRGEVLIGGKNVVSGYYKNPEKTKEDFFDKNGKRWFRSGDIAEIHPDGCIKIIDRKKDLVKLQFGEYVSLGKVESELKMVSVVDNVCIYGDSTKLHTVAIISPNVKQLEQLGQQLGKNLNFQELCHDPDVETAVTKMILEHGKKAGKLEKFEIPTRVKLVTETWLPDSGLVTAAYKLKRKNIQDFYQPLIDQMYAGS